MSVESGQTPLARLAGAASASGRFALDTEFMGEGRYRTLLCLVQLATADAGNGSERVELIDPLSQELDGGPLACILADPAIQVVVHAGRQDIALVRRRFETDVRNVFDTQVAAGFIGMGAQCSYDSLLAELLDVPVGKSASFTRWDARPLSPEQRSYAREDVVHLLALAAELERRLVALGRLDWAREECRLLERSSDERDPEAIFARLPRVRGLSARAQTVARELVRWREQIAARADRPAQSVLSDPALIEIARRRPSSQSALEQIRGAGAANVRRSAQDLLAAVARAEQQQPQAAADAARPPAQAPEDTPLIALCEALLRARAREAGLAYELLAARAELAAVVAARRTGAGEPDVRALRGWRRELVGEELLALLDGRVSLSVSAGRVSAARRAGG